MYVTTHTNLTMSDVSNLALLADVAVCHCLSPGDPTKVKILKALLEHDMKPQMQLQHIVSELQSTRTSISPIESLREKITIYSWNVAPGIRELYDMWLIHERTHIKMRIPSIIGRDSGRYKRRLQFDLTKPVVFFAEVGGMFSIKCFLVKRNL